jgi:hypothetical protein
MKKNKVWTILGGLLLSFHTESLCRAGSISATSEAQTLALRPDILIDYVHGLPESSVRNAGSIASDKLLLPHNFRFIFTNHLII